MNRGLFGAGIPASKSATGTVETPKAGSGGPVLPTASTAKATVPVARVDNMSDAERQYATVMNGQKRF